MNKCLNSFLALFAGLLIFSGCSSIFTPSNTSVQIKLPGTEARAVYSSKEALFKDVKSFNVKLSCEENTYNENGKPGKTVIFNSIEPGNYKVEVEGFNSENEVTVSGRSEVLVKEGEANEVKVELNPVVDFGTTEPTDPVDPTDPVEPTDPVTPTDPVEPADPVEPTDPSDPVVEQNPATVDGAYYVAGTSGLTAEQLNTDEDHIVSTLEEALNKLCPLPNYTGSTDGTIIITDSAVTLTAGRRIGKKITIMPYAKDVTVTVESDAVVQNYNSIFYVSPVSNVTASGEIPSLTIKGNGSSKITFTNNNSYHAGSFINCSSTSVSCPINLEKGFCAEEYSSEYLVYISNLASLKIEDVNIKDCSSTLDLIYTSGSGKTELISGVISGCNASQSKESEGSLIHAATTDVTVGTASDSEKMLEITNNTLNGKNGSLYFAYTGGVISFLSNVKITDNSSVKVFSNNPQSAGIVTNQSKIDFTQCRNVDISNNTMGEEGEKVTKNFGFNSSTQVTVNGAVVDNSEASGNNYKIVIDAEGNIETKD